MFLPIVRICIVFNCKIVLKLAWSWACIWYHTLRCTCNGVALCRSSPHRPSATCWWPIFSIVMKGLCLLLLQPWGDHSQVAHAGMFILHAWTVLQGVMHIIFCGCYTWNSGISSEPEIAFHRGSEALLHLGRGGNIYQLHVWLNWPHCRKLTRKDYNIIGTVSAKMSPRVYQ